MMDLSLIKTGFGAESCGIVQFHNAHNPIWFNFQIAQLWSKSANEKLQVLVYDYINIHSSIAKSVHAFVNTVNNTFWRHLNTAEKVSCLLWERLKYNSLFIGEVWFLLSWFPDIAHFLKFLYILYVCARTFVNRNNIHVWKIEQVWGL